MVVRRRGPRRTTNLIIFVAGHGRAGRLSPFAQRGRLPDEARGRTMRDTARPEREPLANVPARRD